MQLNGIDRGTGGRRMQTVAAAIGERIAAGIKPST
jgi:hypothetical protein